MNFRRKSLCPAVLFGALALTHADAEADPAPASSELAFLAEVPVVLSPARLLQPLNDAPGAVTIIDHAMIRASGARDVAELLRWVPGFQVARRTGRTPLTTYHGLSDDAPRRMLVRVDGRSAYSPYFVSGIEWAKISVDIDDIERIEVFRGSNAAAYGSNAFLGIVNIVTRAAAVVPRARVRVTEGANGLQERVVSVRQRFGNATARLTAARESEHGLDGLDDSFRSRRVDARVDWQLSADHQLEFHLGGVNNRAQTGTAGEATDPLRRTEDDSAFGQMRWRHQLGFGDEINITYFHQQESLDDAGFTLPSLSAYLTNVEGLPPATVAGVFALYGIPANGFVDADNDTRAVRDDIEFEHLWHPSAETRLVWGAGLRRDRVKSMRIFDTDDALTVRQSRLFSNMEWRPTAQWTFNAGAMLEDSDSSGARLSPRLAANWHVTKSTTARAAVSRGYRNLAPYERNADIRFLEAISGVVLQQRFQPTAGLSPERVTTYEVGLRQEWLGGRSSVDLRVFDERVRDMLRRVTVPSNITPLPPPLNRNGETPTYVGGGYADIRGAELSAIHRPSHDKWIGGHYAYVDINSNDRFADATAARHTYTLFAATELPGGWQLSASHGFVGGMQWYVSAADRVGPYHHSALRLARRFAAGPLEGEIALGMDRLFGAVEDFLPDRRRPTQGYATLRIAY